MLGTSRKMIRRAKKRKLPSKENLMGRILNKTAAFAGRASMHGVSYVFDKQQSICNRLLWLIVLLSSAGFSIHLIRSSFVTWQNSKVITTLKTANRPIKVLNFPAITICGERQQIGLIEKVIFREFNKWRKNGTQYLRDDFALFMAERFQITNGTPNLLDVLGMMAAPSVTSSGTKALLENVFANTEESPDPLPTVEESRQCKFKILVNLQLFEMY